MDKNKYTSDMKDKIETILNEARYNGLPTHIVAEQLLDLFSVSQQRELLLAYENYTSKMITGKTNDRTAKSLVNDFLANNCG